VPPNKKEKRNPKRRRPSRMEQSNPVQAVMDDFREWYSLQTPTSKVSFLLCIYLFRFQGSGWNPGLSPMLTKCSTREPTAELFDEGNRYLQQLP
jgi:hypothetical protein